jgi:hypothetical protein
MRPDDVSGRLAAGDSEPDRRQAVKADAIAPPLRGFGLDGLTPSRFELSKQTKADWERPRFQSRTKRQPTELDGKKLPQTKPQTKRKF